MSNFWSGSNRILDTGEQTIANYIWDTGTLAWVPQTSGGSGPSSDVNVTNSSIPVTQAGSWTVALSTGANTIGNVNVNGTVPVSGTFWQATQPVSLASIPLATGAATETTLAVISTKTPALGQTTMANSSPVVIASNQSAVPVSGTFWQATQPVSIASMPSTPVTGTFWQATQPVSGPLTDAQLRATAVPVSLASTTVTNTVTTTEAPPTSVTHAAVTVTTAGTRVQFGSNACKAIVIKANASNSGTIYVGNSGVTSANGFPLAAGDTLSLDISNTNVIYIDASANAQSVNWMANT